MGDLEFSCGAFGRAAMTALTDQGLGFGRDDVCDLALAAAKAMTIKVLAGEANCTQIFKFVYLALRSLPSCHQLAALLYVARSPVAL